MLLVIDVIPLFDAKHGGWQEQEDGVDENAQDGGEHDGGDAAGEEEGDGEGEQAIRERQVSADATDQDDSAYRQLLGIEQVDLSDWIRATPCMPITPNR
jgi:hypothetical protein